MDSEVDRIEGERVAIERASFEATFRAVRRSTALGVITGLVVIGAILLAADVPRVLVVGYCTINLLVRLAAVSAAQWGLRQRTVETQRLAMGVLEGTLVPLGLLSGGSTLLVDHPSDGVNPMWFALLLCAATVGTANILLGHGRSMTFLALVVPLITTAALSAFQFGGTLGILLGCGTVAVGGILIVGNKEAGAIFRQAQRYQFRNQLLVEELSDANSQLQFLAYHDQLTGVRNRAGLNQWVAERTRRDFPVAVVFVDIDGFKKINDNHGHHAGDQALREIAKRLDLTTRDSDVVARFGGDEFIALVEVDSARSGAVVAERVAMCFLDVVDLEHTSVKIDASVGLVVASPQDDLVAMVEHADLAMYDEKRERKMAVQSLATGSD